MKTAEEYRREAKEWRNKRAESQARCGSDGFVSQSCHELNAREADAKAALADDGGMAEFPGLYDLEGNRLCAKLIDGRYGPCWAFLDKPGGDFTGEFLTAKSTWRRPDDSFTKREKAGYKTRVRNLRKKGYVEKLETAPAAVTLAGNGKGFSGLTSVYVKTFRTDGL